MATANKERATTFTTPSELEIVGTHVFDAPRRLVWDAHTKPEHLPHWMLGPDGWTMPVCEIDLRPGGAWHFVWRKTDGAEMSMRGMYKEVVPYERFVHTETWGPEWPETINTHVFTEKNGKTTVTATVRYPSKEARDAATKTGMKDGWSRSNERLAAYLRETVKR